MRYIARLLPLLLLAGAALAEGRLVREWSAEASPWAAEAKALTADRTDWDVTNVHGKMAFVVHGVRQPAFIDLQFDSFRFLDAAHTHWAYLARMGDHQVMVRDGQKPVAFDDILILAPQQARVGISEGGPSIYTDAIKGFHSRRADWAYTADGHVTFLARTHSGVAVVRDGAIVGTCPRVDALVVTAQHWGYVIEDSAGWTIHLDGRTEGPYREKIGPWNIAASPDGARVIYVATTAKGMAVFENGTALYYCPSPNDALARLEFSPDGKRTAWTLISKDSTRPVIDGQVLPFQMQARDNRLLEAFLATPTIPFFSPDSTHTVFLATSWVTPEAGEQDEEPVIKNGFITAIGLKLPAGARVYVVRDGMPGKAYRLISTPHLIYSPDGKHLAFVIYIDRYKWRVVLDDQEVGPVCGNIDRLIFSADGRHLAYLATIDGTPSLVVDGKATPLAPDMVPGSLCISPDSAHTWYQVVKDGLQALVIDGVVQERAFHTVSAPLFLTGHVIYIVRTMFAAGTSSRDALVADGVPTPVGTLIGPLIPDSPTSFHYFVTSTVNGKAALSAVQETYVDTK